MSDAETFSADDPYAPRKKRGCGLVALILGLVGGGGLLLLACCGGFVAFGLGVFAEQVKEDLRGNAVVEEHIGPITSISVNWSGTIAAGGDDRFAFDVEGPKGKGRITAVAKTVDQDKEHVESGTLELPNGERYDLFPDAAGKSR
jgi:hypothetical protein